MAALSPVSDGVAERRLAAPQRRSRSLRLALRSAAGIGILIATVLFVGLGPFLRGIAAISPVSALAALALATTASAAAAWRWRAVANGYGLALKRRAAFAAYYRSQFLNAVLPAGVLGDVHRAWTHGRDQARLGSAARAVAVERILGQCVQIMLTLAILLPLGFGSALVPLGFGSALVPLAWCAGVSVVAVVVAGMAAALLPGARRLVRREWDLMRPVLARPAVLMTIVLASIVVVGSHVALFVVASLVAGLPFDGGIVAVGLVVLAASAIPISIGGWGPREAAAGVAFAAIGLGAPTGVSISATFGALALIGVVPGAVLLLVDRRRAA
ncbi:lysylphosphatidylglycerol synthase domain-containing protein [Microbacterium xylanilyticum]